MFAVLLLPHLDDGNEILGPRPIRLLIDGNNLILNSAAIDLGDRFEVEGLGQILGLDSP